MELWKVHKYCSAATLPELNEAEARLLAGLRNGTMRNTNAEKVLEIVREYIEVRKVFSDKE